MSDEIKIIGDGYFRDNWLTVSDIALTCFFFFRRIRVEQTFRLMFF